MSVLENFVKDLISENIIVNYQADKNEVRDFYNKKYRQQGKCSFSDFHLKLWKDWYIDTFTRRIIYFDQRWIDYFSLEVGVTHLIFNLLNENVQTEELKCPLCNITFTNASSLKTHQNGLHHKTIVKFAKGENNFFTTNEDIKFELILRNNHNSSVHVDELKLEIPVKTDITAHLIIKNTSPIMINIVDIIKINCFISDITIEGKFDYGVLLESGEQVEVDIHAFFESSTHLFYPIVAVSSARGSRKKIFNLVQLEFQVTSEFSYLHSKSKYVNNIPKVISALDDSNDIVIPGNRPDPYVSHYKETLPLKQYKIPQKLENQLKELISKYPQFVAKGFSALTPYKVFYSALELKTPTNDKNNLYANLETLLHLEENQLRIDMRDYDMEASLEVVKGSGLYNLEVPGLAEARPSLLTGDRVYIKEEKHSSAKFEGIVHKVLETSVHLGLNFRFNKIFLPKKKFHIGFDFNRRTIRVQKQALNLALQHNIVPSLYPELIEIALLSTIPNNIECFNRLLNEEQIKAVNNILKPKNIPFIIFGPPGTGKTVTVVESVYQLWKHYPNSRILICAPSNSAINEVAVRLVKVIPKSEMFRLLGSAYATEVEVMKDIKDIVNIRNDRDFYMPSMEQLLKFRIMMVTTVTAARLVNGGVPNGHYSHVFIDESGFATETETLIPIAGILSNADCEGKLTGQIILAGDPRQLSPVVHSLFAKHCGYGTSFLERLTTSGLYYRDEINNSYDERCVTKLKKNYRSHEAILKVPNDLFYNKELIAVGNDMTNLFIGSDNLKNKNFPIIFHHVEGQDERDKTSPSFFNVQEIERVVEYITELLSMKVCGIKITQKDIGVVTPYRKQVEKIRSACSKRGWNSLLIGSVEQFQGKERLIIIISTVRSKNAHKFENIDQQCKLGFIKSPKRFNVALTRAKALLIVIGNGNVLKKDTHWLKFLEYCSENRSLAGRPFDLNQTTEDPTNI